MTLACGVPLPPSTRMERDFFDPSPEEQQVVLVSTETVREAAELSESCEYCHPDDAEIPFDWILDRMTGNRGMREFSRLSIYTIEVRMLTVHAVYTGSQLL